MNGIFITGTDTGVGKTVVSGLLAGYLSYKGYNTITQKWIETGICDSASDIDLHLALMGKRKDGLKECLADISPYTFKFAASPHLASTLEKKPIREKKIRESFRSLSKRFDFVIVEGAGGLLVPFNKKRLIVDMAKSLNLPAIVVSGNKLGAINHTLLTIEGLRMRRIKIIGIVFNNLSSKVNKMVLEDNPRIVESLSGERVLGILPYSKNKNLLHKTFAPIGNNILRHLRKENDG